MTWTLLAVALQHAGSRHSCEANYADECKRRRDEEHLRQADYGDAKTSSEAAKSAA